MDLPDPERDREIIRAPARWPLRPILPLKQFREARYGEAGCMVEQYGPTVFELPWWEAWRHVQRGTLGGRARTTYATVEALLADGWRVD